MIRRSELIIVGGDDPLGGGGYSKIWKCTHKGAPRVFKEYKPEQLNKIDRDTLRFIVNWPHKLPPADQTALRRICAWPDSLVTSPTGELVGLLMPQAPKEFFQIRGDKAKPRHASRMAIPKESADKQQLPYFDFPHKLARLGHLLTSLQFLHTIGVVVGDLQWKNALVASPEPRTGTRQEDMFLVDCDSFVVAGRQAFSHDAPPQWVLPYPIDEFSETTDLFKFALMSIRCLAEKISFDSIDYSDYLGLLPSADFEVLHTLLTSPNPGLSSADISAMARAWQASVNRNGQQFRRRDGVLRELWTEPMRKAHLAGLPDAPAPKPVVSPKPAEPPEPDRPPWLAQILPPTTTQATSPTASPASSPTKTRPAKDNAATSRVPDRPSKPAAATTAADTAPDAKGHAVGVLLGVVAVAACVAAYIFFMTPSGSDGGGAGGPATTSSGPSTPPPASSSPLSDAKAGDCIHIDDGEAQPDGTKKATVNPAACGTPYATHRVTAIVTDGSQCANQSWVRASGSPTIYACLQIL